MTEDEIKALKASRQSRLERAITPTNGRGGYAPRYNPPSITLKPPKWEVWGNMLEVEWHEACALALNIDPDTVVEEGGDMYPHDSWYRLPSHEIKEDFEDLMKLLRSNLRDFTSTYNNTVLLSEFANFCVRIKRKNLPQELVALAQENPQAAPAAKGKAVKRSITKQQVINAFEGFYFDRNGWNNALSDVPKWIEDCRVTPGRKGDKTTSATWNPVLIAAALIDKGKTAKQLDAVFVRLKDWADEWREVSASFRD
jgi:hypothetical protein